LILRMEYHMMNLLAQPCTLRLDGGGTVTIPPSGIVAHVEEPMSGATARTFTVGAAQVSIVVEHIDGNRDPVFHGIPRVPGHYIVAAQVCAEAARVGLELHRGVTLYTPAPLIFPGQPGHPGGDVRGPVAPALILRYEGGAWVG
jgi:hypothetical protein